MFFVVVVRTNCNYFKWIKSRQHRWEYHWNHCCWYWVQYLWVDSVEAWVEYWIFPVVTIEAMVGLVCSIVMELIGQAMVNQQQTDFDQWTDSQIVEQLYWNYWIACQTIALTVVWMRCHHLRFGRWRWAVQRQLHLVTEAVIVIVVTVHRIPTASKLRKTQYMKSASFSAFSFLLEWNVSIYIFLLRSYLSLFLSLFFVGNFPFSWNKLTNSNIGCQLSQMLFEMLVMFFVSNLKSNWIPNVLIHSI